MTVSENPSTNNAPRFTDSPAIEWFGHYIPDDGVVDAKNVRIYWNCSALTDDDNSFTVPKTFRIHDVAVFYWPEDLIEFDGYLWHRMRDLAKGLRYSHGNIISNWNNTCLEWLDGIWGDYTDLGFLNDAEARRALEEFARIRECPWARDHTFAAIKGRPWTQDDYLTLATMPEERKVEMERREAWEAVNPKTELIIHVGDFKHIFLNKKHAIEFFTRNKKIAEARLAEWESGNIVIDRDDPVSYAPMPEDEVRVHDDESLMQQIKARSGLSLRQAEEGLKKIKAGEFSESICSEITRSFSIGEHDHRYGEYERRYKAATNA